MSEAKAFGYGIAIGAGAMFLFDPRGGRARRALVRDKSIRVAHEVEHAAEMGARDLEHRVEGLKHGSIPRRRVATPALRFILGAISAVYGLASLFDGKPFQFLLGGAGVIAMAQRMRGPASHRPILGGGHAGKSAGPSNVGQVAPSPAMP
jgi:hypothetical protein